MEDLVDKFPDMPIATGGGGGLMEMANKVAHRKGSVSVGVTLNFEREPENKYVQSDSTMCALDFYTRQGLLLDRARMVVCLPGGPGTLFELFDAMVHIQTTKRAHHPIYLFDSEFWSPMYEVLKWMVRAGTLDKDYLCLVRMIDSADEIDEINDNKKIKETIENAR